MGKGLGLLQSKILVMANVNRLLDGLETSHPTIELRVPIDREALNEYCQALHALRDKLSKLDLRMHSETGFHRYDARYVHNALLDTIFSEPKAPQSDKPDAEKSFAELWFKIAGSEDLTIWEHYKRAAESAAREGQELIKDFGLEPLEELWRAEWRFGTVEKTLGNYETEQQATDAKAALREKGVPEDRLGTWYSLKEDHLRVPEVLADVYGFRPYLLQEKHRQQRRIFPQLLFDRQAIGERRYNAAIVVTFKAITSLEQRRLVTTSNEVYLPGSNTSFTGHTVLALRQSGIEEAERIKAKMPDVTKDLSFYQMA
jgi:hypothetical protein